MYKLLWISQGLSIQSPAVKFPSDLLSTTPSICSYKCFQSARSLHTKYSSPCYVQGSYILLPIVSHFTHIALSS